MVSSGVAGLREFLHDYPLMTVKPSAKSSVFLKGRFAFVAHSANNGEIADCFGLLIEVPKAFPKDLPTVTETDGKIPRMRDFHVNSDGSLCLGSPLRLLLKLSRAPTLNGFAENCLVPYLFAISHKLKNGGPMLFGELAHYTEGMLSDYVVLFGLNHAEQARYALKLLGMKKRRANKLRCPCGCGNRLGRCRFNARLREYRALASRSWFKSQTV